MSGGVSEQEIERELQTLRNLRRRSISSPGPGELAVDPDLPPPSPTRDPTSPASLSPTYTSNDDITLSTPDGLDDGAGLFWVPAHLHPELAPGEFRAFLKAHTHTDPEHADASEAGEAPGVARSQSWLARSNSRKEGLGRKRSMLSKQYHPSAADRIEEERPPMPIHRSGSIYGGKTGEKGVTLQDLQKLETLVDEADRTGDPETMRTALRRSLSRNVAPGFLAETNAEGGALGLGAPRPASILRRSVRTKIRKANLPGDGGGHRFAATRKGRTTAAPDIEIPEDDYDGRKHSDPSEESIDMESGENESMTEHESETFYDAAQHIEQYGERRGSDTSTDEANIFDAYARQSRSSSASSESISYEGTTSIEDSPPERTSPLPPVLPKLTPTGPVDWYAEEGEKTPTQERPMDPLSGMRRTTSGPLSIPMGTDQGKRSSSTSPTSPTTPVARSATLPVSSLPPGMAPPQQRASLTPAPQPQPQQAPPPMTSVNVESRPPLHRVASPSGKEKEKEKEKEKKGGFFSKKDKKDKEKSKKEKEGFLGSLFGSKKKVEEPSSVSNFSADGRAAAAALLGSSKSAKSLGHQASSNTSPTSPGFSNFARYPIHVERAIYRLSHIKLANARRPLFEQVLISNLMFWYLGVIGRNVQEEKKPGSTNGKGDEEKEQKVVVKGTPPKASDIGSAGTPIPHDPPSPAPKKTGLTKPERSRAGRDNEAPVRTPQYGQQNAQVEHEVRAATAQVQSMSMKGSRSQGPASREYQHSPPPPGQGHPQPQRSVSQSSAGPSQTPPPVRALSPPTQGQPPPGRPMSDQYPANPQAVHREIPNQPRGVPQSSFGPPPPSSGPASPFADRPDPRQRTLSQPGYAPNQPPPPSGPMRRVVTDGRPPDPRAHNTPSMQSPTGPQPGQLFQYPGGAAGSSGPSSPFPPRSPVSPPPHGQAQPGQIFTQPGQVYHHQQPPLAPPLGQVFHQPQTQPHPSQMQQQQQRPPQSRPLPEAGRPAPQQRLPPGASDPQWVADRPKHVGGPPPQYPNQPPLHQHQQQQPQHLQRPYPPQPPSQPQPQGHLVPGQAPHPGQYPQHHLPRSQSQQFHPNHQQQPPMQIHRQGAPVPGPGSPGPQPGQLFSPPQQLQQQQRQQPQPQQVMPHGYPATVQDGYRRAQPIPPAQYGHHR